MSENLDHESGGTFIAKDIITVQCGNTKMIIVQNAAPGTTYDGQIWEDADEITPVMKIQDKTNSQWMTKVGQFYETGSFQSRVPSVIGDGTNGVFVTQNNTYDSVVYLHMRSNGRWWAVVGV